MPANINRVEDLALSQEDKPFNGKTHTLQTQQCDVSITGRKKYLTLIRMEY